MNNLEIDISAMRTFMTKYSTFKSVIENLYLIALTDSYERLICIQEINLLSENKIRNKIQYDFEHYNKKITEYINEGTITFNSESQIVLKNDVYRTDIKLYCCNYKRDLFIIECKKFNPKNYDYIQGSFNKKNNKYEYNGIERFTELIYARNDKYAGMIGFICSGDIITTIENLKRKVKEFRLVNDSDNLLNKKCADWEFSFQSKHIRIDYSTILLYHLFFDFRSERNKKINLMLKKE